MNQESLRLRYEAQQLLLKWSELHEKVKPYINRPLIELTQKEADLVVEANKYWDGVVWPALEAAVDASKQ
jgi:hypothetical protein